MFAERTYAGNMSKKAVLFDISRKHIEGANMWPGMADAHLLHWFTRHFMWRDSNIAGIGGIRRKSR